MVTTLPGAADEFLPDPEDWPGPDPSQRSPEALQNEPDDLAQGLPEAAKPTEADEADVIDQLRDGGPDEDAGPADW